MHEQQAGRIMNRDRDRSSDDVTVELAGQGLAFVTTTHPNQARGAKMRTFVKQNSQKRGKRKQPDEQELIEAVESPVVSSWARDVPTVRRKPSRAEVSDATAVSVSTVVEQAEEQEDEIDDEDDIVSSWSRDVPKGRAPVRSRVAKEARRKMRTRQAAIVASRSVSPISTEDTNEHRQLVPRPMSPPRNGM